MKQATEEGLNAINFYKSEAQRHQSAILNAEQTIVSVILTEKLKLNIPLDWAFDLDTGRFLSPSEIDPETGIIELGPTKLPVLSKNVTPRINSPIAQQPQTVKTENKT